MYIVLVAMARAFLSLPLQSELFLNPTLTGAMHWEALGHPLDTELPPEWAREKSTCWLPD